LGDYAFILFMEGTGKHNVSMLGCLVEKEINGYIEIELLKTTGDEVVVWKRNLGIETDAQQPAYFATVNAAKHLVAIDSCLGHFVDWHSPDAGYVSAMFRVADVAGAGKLIAFLPVLASALSVGLAGDGGIAATFATDAARGQHHIDCAQTILHPVAVMFDSARMQEEAGFGFSPPIGSLTDRTFRDAGNLGGLFWIPDPNVLSD
jgi:hypothetical protein